MRAAQPSSTAGSSFPCHRVSLICNQKQRVHISISTPPLVHAHKYTQTLCPCISSSYFIFQPLLNPPFCFSFHPGVILPGETQHVEFIFKSDKAGIRTETWQLNTHPVLLQGASMQVTLKGVALFQDKTADQRLFIEVVYNYCITCITQGHMGKRYPLTENFVLSFVGVPE